MVLKTSRPCSNCTVHSSATYEIIVNNVTAVVCTSQARPFIKSYYFKWYIVRFVLFCSREAYLFKHIVKVNGSEFLIFSVHRDQLQRLRPEDDSEIEQNMDSSWSETRLRLNG